MCKKYFLTFLVNLWVLCCIHNYCGRHSVHRLLVGHPWSFQEDGKEARADIETPMNDRLQLQEATSKAAFRSWHQDKDANQGELQLIPYARQASLGEWNQSPHHDAPWSPGGSLYRPSCQLTAHIPRWKELTLAVRTTTSALCTAMSCKNRLAGWCFRNFHAQ